MRAGPGELGPQLPNDDTQVISDPTSRCSGGFPWPMLACSFARRSARAILSGSRSLMSTYSSACMRRTSLAGMGARLLANLNGGALVGRTSPGIVAVRGARGTRLHTTLVAAVPPGASGGGRDRTGLDVDVGGRSGKVSREVGRVDAACTPPWPAPEGGGRGG